MSQNLARFAAQQHCRQPFAAMRRHHDEIAPLRLRGLENGVIGVVAGFTHRLAGHARLVGAPSNEREVALVAVSPHNYNSTLVALASTVHASATMPNFTITEYFLPFVDFCDKISPNQLKPRNGYIELPTAPGLGVDVDEAALAKYPGKVYTGRKLRHPADEPGGI